MDIPTTSKLKGDPNRPLSRRQKRLAAALADPRTVSGAQAARTAGYAPSNARFTASRNATLANVAAEILRLQIQHSDKSKRFKDLAIASAEQALYKSTLPEAHPVDSMAVASKGYELGQMIASDSQASGAIERAHAYRAARSLLRAVLAGVALGARLGPDAARRVINDRIATIDIVLPPK